MERTFCDMLFGTSASLNSDEPIIKHNNESLFGITDWNCNEDEIDICLNMYDQLLNDDNQTANDYSSEWESCVSDELEDEDEAGVDNYLMQSVQPLAPSNIPIAKKDESSEMISFCELLHKQLPKFCDFDQIDSAVREEMEATENDTVHMDLLTCSAATANCYRESSHKPLIRSKYGKWSCNGRLNPAIGLGPLSQLFMENYVSYKMINEQNRLELNQNQSIQTSINFMSPTINNQNYKTQAEFDYRDFERDITTEYPDSYQIYYNRDYNHLYNDSQNNLCEKNTFCNQKCCKTDVQSQQMSSHSQQMSSNNCWHFNYAYNNYNCEPNLMQSTYY